MNRKLETLDLCAAGALGAAAIGTAWVYDRLPDPMPTHFDVHGVPNGWMPRAVGAFLLPVIGVLVWALVRFGGGFLPTEWRDRLATSPLAATGLLVAGLLASVQWLVIDAALSPSPRLGTGVWVVLGVFFVLLGQLLPRVRRNPFIGVRTTWTMTSDENWARTHRVAGYTMSAGGALAALSALAGAPVAGLGFILVGALAPVVYSWRLARGG
jgi:uncharacterized membrane protein